MDEDVSVQQVMILQNGTGAITIWKNKESKSSNA